MTGDNGAEAHLVSGLDDLSSTFTWDTAWIYERADSGIIDPDSSVVLEAPRPLSASGLWSLQREFFTRRGLDAWIGGAVPQHVTTNRFVADLHAQLLIAWIRDGLAMNPPGTPFTIIELGAGSGRFGFHLIDRLTELLDESELRGTPVRLVMTDVAGANVDTWQAHPALAPFVRRGVLDFALFDVTEPAPITLRVSGHTIDADSGAGPVAVIANYVFDSVPHDCFAVGEDGLREAWLSLVGAPDHDALGGPELLGPLHLAGSWHPVAGGRYPEASLTELLAFYEQTLTIGTVFTLPVAAVRCLEFLRGLVDDHLLVLMTDTGTSRFDDVNGGGLPTFMGHGSFSVGVNFHALGRMTEAAGGRVLRTTDRQKHVEVVGLQFGADAHRPDAVSAAYRRTIEEFGPNRFLFMETAVRPQYKLFTIDQLLAVLRWAHHDSSVLLDMLPAILELVEDGIGPVERAQLHQSLDSVWRSFYFMAEPEDLAFEIARVLDASGLSGPAATYLARSEEHRRHIPAD